MARKQKQEVLTGFRFELGGFEWRVILVDAIDDRDLGKAWGLCDADARIIQITRHSDREFMRISLFHEFFHACVSPISGSVGGDLENKVYEEHAAELLGQGMTQLMRQRHMLPAWVFNDGFRVK